MDRDNKRPFARLMRWGGALAVALAAAIAGCGGGVGVGGTGAYSSGPIDGFGSVIVNGIEFDDANARIEDEDGGLSSRSALRLGMVAEVDSGPIAGTADVRTAVASRIRFGSELVGTVGDVDVAAAALVVFGQTVKVTTTTVFDERFAAGLASVSTGAVVEVFGFYDAVSEGFVATRIEPRTDPVASFKVRGPVSDLDSAARRFTIGAVDFSYSTAPAGLADGMFVRLQVETQPVNGAWVVRSFGDGQRLLGDIDRARLRGPITAYTSAIQFSVNGQPVDASVASFPDGQAGVVLGARVEVEGAVVAGVLRAAEVELDDDGGAEGGFELKGAIQSYLPAELTFVLRDVTVFYGDSGVQFEQGTVADLGAGVEVEVRGVLSADGTRLLATRIRFRD